MSYVVRKVGGGVFNPKAMCISKDSAYLFVACGCQINIYALPDLAEIDTITTHKSHITSLVCDSDYLISSDDSGMIFWHKFTGMTVIEKKPTVEFDAGYPIERLILRNGKLFYIFFHRRLFWCVEYNNEESIFMIDNEMQKSFIKKLHEGSYLQGKNPIRFTTLDGFDINEQANSILLVDKCKIHVYNFETGEMEMYPNPVAVHYARFRGNKEVIAFLANGMMFVYGNRKIPIRDHWHYACPNAFVYNDTTIISGGFEGVLTFYNQNTHRHDHLPRLGITIEGLALSSNGRFITVIFDKNMLAVVDASAANHAVISDISNVIGNVSFSNGKLISIRKPNLVQIFDCNTGKYITQQQVSSYNSNVPLTAVELSKEYMITVETSGGKADPKLTIGGQVSMNHKRPRANKPAHDFAYEKLLLRERYSAMRQIKKIKYGKAEDITLLNEENKNIEREGNPLIKDPDAADTVDYSEIKIWRIADDKFEFEQSFRAIGKTANPISMHPTLRLFTVVVSHELQVWKRSSDTDMWEMFRSSHLPIIPSSLVWSSDGTILVAQYAKRVDLMNAETLEIIAEHSVDALVNTVKFISDCEIAIQSTLGVAIYDLRTLSESKMIFAQAACADASDGAFVFVLNKQQPVVVLYDNGQMFSWQVPALAPINKVAITRVGSLCRITCVDDDYFIWGIDEFGLEQKEKSRPLIITPPKPRNEAKKAVKLAIVVDKKKELEELYSAPSHQIMRIEMLCDAFSRILLEPRKKHEAASIPVKIEQEIDADSLKATEYSISDISEMREEMRKAFN